MDRQTRDKLVYHALRVVLWIGCRLPLWLTRPVCRGLARLALPFATRDVERMRDHIAIAFPDHDEREQRRLIRGCADHLGCVLAEVAWLWGARPEDVESICEYEGLEYLHEAFQAGRGVIVATGHIGNWELLNAGLASVGIPVTVAVRELDDSRTDSLINELRCRFGSEVVLRTSSAGRQLVKAIACNRGIGLLIDQDIPSIPGVFVPFFGRDAWTPSGAAMLALRTRCPLVPGFIHRKPDGTHKIVIGPPFPVPREGSLQDRVRELTAAATARVEWHVRAWPQQWVWMHRRWRTRPESESADRDS
jgi:KDO2-lipid IV(A) lauroyltransferase